MMRAFLAAIAVLLGLQECSAGRISLTAPLTLHVSTAGNDANDGLTTATPFKTFRKCYNVVADQYDLATANTEVIGSISGTTLTVTLVVNGSLSVGQLIYGPPHLGMAGGVDGVLGGTAITALLTGSGGVGTYTVSIPQSVQPTMIYTPTATCLSAPGQTYVNDGLRTYKGVVGQGNAFSVLMDGNGSEFHQTNNTPIWEVGNIHNAEPAYSARFAIRRMKLSADDNTITRGVISNGGLIVVADGMEFGSMTGGVHLHASGPGAYVIVQIPGAYTVSGGAVCHALSWAMGSTVVQSVNVNLVGNPEFGTKSNGVYVQGGYACAQWSGQVYGAFSTWTGTARGRRFFLDHGGLIDSQAGLNYFPGSQDGVATNGWYGDNFIDIVASTIKLSGGNTALTGYSEGLFTPVLQGTAPAGAPTYTMFTGGSWEQIGRQVTLRWYVGTTALGGPGGIMQVAFPTSLIAGGAFNDAGHCWLDQVTGVALTPGYSQVTGDIQPGTSVIRLLKVGFGGVGTAGLTAAEMAPASALSGGCSFHR